MKFGAQDVAINQRALVARIFHQIIRVGRFSILLIVNPNIAAWRLAQQQFRRFAACARCAACNRTVFLRVFQKIGLAVNCFGSLKMPRGGFVRHGLFDTHVANRRNRASLQQGVVLLVFRLPAYAQMLHPIAAARARWDDVVQKSKRLILITHDVHGIIQPQCVHIVFFPAEKIAVFGLAKGVVV